VDGCPVIPAAETPDQCQGATFCSYRQIDKMEVGKVKDGNVKVTVETYEDGTVE
jgi:hypothetical protein